jgi:two-component system sensor histidine kinase BaeS
MRRRLTVALVAMAVITLLLTAVGSLLLINRSTASSQESELLAQTRAAVMVLGQPLLGQSSSLATTTTTLPGIGRRHHGAGARKRVAARRVLARNLKRIGNYRDLEITSVGAGGRMVPTPPPPLTETQLQPDVLRSGGSVSGSTDGLVFAAVPLGADGLRTDVLVGTRALRDPLSGLGYFFLVAAAVLALATLVAAYLARRITRPLVGAVVATERIAEGDLGATVSVGSRDYPELQDLAAAINSMSAALARSRGLERQFLLSVSHELRTPLTSIRGYADALAEGATDDVAGAVRVIETEARRLDRLVQDLLDLARLDARQFSLSIAPVDCAELARRTVDAFLPEAASLAIRVVAPTEAPTALWVDADPDRLRQVVANLIENALKYATSTIEVGVGVDGSVVALWVEDDGPGIGAEELGRVFDRHFHSDRTPARRVGTGLGLAIVAELVAAMGGRVGAESPCRDGHGTRMTVQLRARHVGPVTPSTSVGVPTNPSISPPGIPRR